MRYLGLDLGSRTLGISISDVTCSIASTLKTIRFDDSCYDSLIPIIKEIIDEFKISKIILGFPKNMNGTIGERGNICLEFRVAFFVVLIVVGCSIYKYNISPVSNSDELKQIEVVMQDERLSTVEATNYMIKADMSRKKRKQKVDSLAANIILQTYLDKEKGRL